MLALPAVRVFDLLSALPGAPDDMCHCVAPAPASGAFLDLNDEDSDVDFAAPVAAVLEVPEGQMLDLNEDDDDVSDYYTIRRRIARTGCGLTGAASPVAPVSAHNVFAYFRIFTTTCRTFS